MATVRVEKKLHDTLRELSKAEHRSIGEVIEEAIAKYEKDKFWKGVHEDYARLRANPEAWAEYQREVEIWDTLSNDGLENEEPYYTPEEEEEIRAEFARSQGR